MAFALSYCILLCPVWLSFLLGLFNIEEETEGEWIWGTGKWGSGVGSGGRENCGLVVLYDRRIFSLFGLLFAVYFLFLYFLFTLLT